MKELLDEIKSLQLGKVNLLALVTSTSYEVVFYALVNGAWHQSNELAVNGQINPLKLEEFYGRVAELIRQSGDFQQNQLNVVEIRDTGDISTKHEPLDTSIYNLKKVWKDTILK